MLWACILLPQLSLDGVLRRLPTSSQALALISGPPQQRRLHAVNASAQAQGLRPGMALAAASALFPHFLQIEHQPAEQARLLELLCAWGYRFSSQVSQQGDDAVLLEVRASLKLFGPWPAFERRLREDLSALGCTHQIALAPTPLGAYVLAGVHDGIAVFDLDILARALDGVELSQAGLPPAALVTLQAMGLHKLRQLYALPRAALGRRLGPQLLCQLDRLRGSQADPRKAYRPPAQFSARLELGYELQLQEALLFPIKRLIGDLAAYLSGRDCSVQQFELTLEHAQGLAPSVLKIGLLSAERDPARLMEITRVRLERCQLPAPVRALQLQAAEFSAWLPSTADLYQTRPAESLPWPALRERLRARLGEHALHQLEVLADARPEYARQTVTMLTREPEAVWSLPRPAWLLERPIPLRDPHIELLAGPERIESGWWDGADVQRDYYVVQTSLGQRAWVYCTANSLGPWMLHGFFA